MKVELIKYKPPFYLKFVQQVRKAYRIHAETEQESKELAKIPLMTGIGHRLNDNDKVEYIEIPEWSHNR